VAACLGVFDSGVGGLTVLAALRAALPSVPLLYIADSAHAPYGERSQGFIVERSLALTQHLINAGAKLVVIACNTATAAAAEAVRARHPDLPVVGIEPGVKPAVAASRTRKIGVLATTATVNSPRFRTLLERHAQGCEVIPVACSGVVKHIEAGDLDSAELKHLVARYCAPLQAAGVDTVLLGCTHYPFIRTLWQAQLGAAVQLLQIEGAVAQQAARRWSHALDNSEPPEIRLATTGDPEVLGRLAREGLRWDRFVLERCTV